MYRVFETLKVNSKSGKKDVDFGNLYDDLEISYCQNWAGDDWFIRIKFKGKGTNRIYGRKGYDRFNFFRKITNRMVKEFIIKERKANFKEIDKIIIELFGKKPKWKKVAISMNQDQEKQWKK